MNDQWGSTKSVIALMIGDNEERRVFQKDWNTLFRCYICACCFCCTIVVTILKAGGLLGQPPHFGFVMLPSKGSLFFIKNG
ncbi:hypothetical protein [Geobacillus sp. WSUCF-018B]|uniref:hypothetical protein n=1 Tax=Geobacillus TaxID=129337 RepID=UPI000C295149|nr:hypothetical protein [Geobacillus sp. WSUCF-018B]MED4878783.1 hypothetical protein [Anoxybacillus geothermalis]WJP99611.1 hypothetical protein QT234_13220 [Geobacillus stearothermophilus]MED4924374.1 hypothetical protein [Anoxybacillus geothermalis]PJW16275.1 hypothetical protein CV944_15440 [Geobacillus sp. WSUCF-018B]WJQ02915.1 hypothetical protein QT236_12815 [Geobacillus stearothermophilus]